MNLGAYTWWGVIVFVVELLGASTTVLYGLNLLWIPLNEHPEADEERHGLTKVSGAARHADACASWCRCELICSALCCQMPCCLQHLPRVLSLCKGHCMAGRQLAAD